MTIVGKILVFINLIFSLLVSGFVIMLHTVSTPWAEEYKNLSKRYEVLKASNDAYQGEKERVMADAEKQRGELRAELKTVKDDLEAEVALNKKLRDDLVTAKKTFQGESSVTGSLNAEVQLRQQDVARLRTALKKENDTNLQLVKENNSLRDRAVAAEVQRDSWLTRAQALQKQVRTMEVDMTRIKANAGATTTTSLKAKNPPPESIEGLIMQADPRSGLVTLSIGGDAGLTRGNTLEAFRLGRLPEQSKYLGTIRIMEVTPHQAVGQIIGKPAVPLQRGDHVASRILGG